MRQYKAPQVCSIENCTKDVQSLGLCYIHYYRQRKHGDAMYVRPEALHNKNKAEFGIWAGVKQRCYNPNATAYPYYGAKGIVMDERWLGKEGFRNFLTDMGKRPDSSYTIERKDSKDNYSPENCRWATRNEQAVNRSNNTSHIGVHQTKTGWTAQLVVNKKIVLRKTYHTFEEAQTARKEAEAKWLKTNLA